MALKAKKSSRESSGKKEAIESVTAEAIKRLNINIPESKHKALKIKAAENGETISEAILKWVDEYLSK